VTDVYIVGIDKTRFGRYPGADSGAMASRCGAAALDDCGLGIHDVQALYSGQHRRDMTGSVLCS